MHTDIPAAAGLDDSAHRNDSGAEIRTPGYCALCVSTCGSVLVTKGGRFIAQEPNPDHPTGQALCVKGKAAPEIVYNANRELYPLRRTRPKGDADPGWQRISWDEALDETAARLLELRARYGAETVAFGKTTPSGTPAVDNARWIDRFTHVFGSPNVGKGQEICNWHKDYAHVFTFGRGISSPDFDRAGCVVLWGHNPSATWLDHATAVAKAKARGASLIVVDPRRVGFASRADVFLQVRPGADAALALGIAGQMLKNGWYDKAFVRQWSNGPLLVRSDTNRFLRAGDLLAPPPGSGPDDLVAIDAQGGGLVRYNRDLRLDQGTEFRLEASQELRLADGQVLPCTTAFSLYSALCSQYPPERVAKLAWVEPSAIEAAARALHADGPVAYYGWSGLGQHTNATQTDRAIATLMALTGSFDLPGGNVEFGKPKAAEVGGAEFLPPEQRAKNLDLLMRSSLGPGRQGSIGADVMYTAMLTGAPYPVRALFNFGRNYLVNHANGDRGVEALASLDFMVQAAPVMSATGLLADIFLPINTPWEREAVRVGFGGSQAAENLVQLRCAAIPSLGESRSDGEVVFELAKRMGFGDKFWDGDIDAGLDHMLAPLGLDVATLRRNPGGVRFDNQPRYFNYRKLGFNTPTGRLEIFSEQLRDIGIAPLPEFNEPNESPFQADADEFPLVLTCAKTVNYCHSQHRDIASLRKRGEVPEVSLHPDAAAIRDIHDGDPIRISTRTGSMKMRARFDTGIDPKVVFAQYGWWRDAQEAQSVIGPANYGALIDDTLVDPVSGSSALRSSMCELSALVPSTKAWTGWREFELALAVPETHDIHSFRISPIDGKALPQHTGGQHLTIRVIDDAAGTIIRCYTLSGPVVDNGYRISVKKSPPADRPSSMSQFLHRLAPGRSLRLSALAPKGEFCLDLEEEGIDGMVFVAGGVGITPTLGMVHDLRRAGWRGRATLLYAVRSSRDFAFKDELRDLKKDLPGLSIQLFVGHDSELVEEDWLECRRGHVGSPEVLRALAERAPVYMCGPPQMIAAIHPALIDAGLDESRIRLEAFGPSGLKKPAIDTPPQKVIARRSGVALQWRSEGGALLDALEAAGLRPQSGCRTGQCQSCAVKLLSGEVLHPKDATQPDPGQCLVCVAVPLSEVVLDL